MIWSFSWRGIIPKFCLQFSQVASKFNTWCFEYAALVVNSGHVQVTKYEFDLNAEYVGWITSADINRLFNGRVTLATRAESVLTLFFASECGEQSALV